MNTACILSVSQYLQLAIILLFEKSAYFFKDNHSSRGLDRAGRSAAAGAPR